MTLTAELVGAARRWLLDRSWEENFWADNWIQELSAEEIERGIERYYEGGLRQFVIDAIQLQ